VFQILKNPKFDFMQHGRLALAISSALVLVSVGVLFVRGLNEGIEFTGGTELQIKYMATPDLASIRGALKDEGLAAQVTTIGTPEENEIYIRLAEGAEKAEGDAATDRIAAVITALRAQDEQQGRLDLNVADQATIRGELESVSSLSSADAMELAAAISAERKTVAIFKSLDDIGGLPGMTPEVRSHFEQNAYFGSLALRSQSYIGPAVGEELMNKTKLAIVFSLIMMMVYIWIRFQLQWGFAAVLALTHDTLITLGLFALFTKEMSLPVVAAFLTLVGYSVNDTVVVFDRIRENLRNRSGATLEETINLSINQTLGRTIITSGLTWVVVFGLYLYGGPALNAFAFVLTVGVIVGTYSSIYVASPLLMLWGKAVSGAAGSAPAVAAGTRRVKKVRT
jgi:preprotein translocase subunit SecF